jgi:hypothetical protein
MRWLLNHHFNKEKNMKVDGFNSFLIVMSVVLLCSVVHSTSKMDVFNVDAVLVDKTPVSPEKHYSVYMYNGGVQVANFSIKSWRLGIGNDILYCDTIDNGEIIIKGDWIICEE